MSPNDSRHGTYAGAIAHWLSDGRPCHPCEVAEWRYRKTRKLRHIRGEVVMAPAVGVVRRYQALLALGYTGPRIAAETGLSIRTLRSVQYHGHVSVRPETAEKMAAAYERLSMTRPEGRYANRARSQARARGWLPPLAWDDIDDPNERPTATTRDGNWEDQVDHAIVWRVVNEQTRPRKLTRAESAEVARVLLSRGVSTFAIENDYGIKAERYKEAVA